VKIYTRTGDKGETGLGSGRRVSKDALRVEAYGSVDELNSVLGLARSFLNDVELDAILNNLQRDLFTVGADLAAPDANAPGVPRVDQGMIDSVERTIDKLEGELPPLKVFILPGGTQAAALLHFARSVARRAERRIVALNNVEKVSEMLIPYINRLSDLLFVIARAVNRRSGVSETEWHRSP